MSHDRFRRLGVTYARLWTVEHLRCTGRAQAARVSIGLTGGLWQQISIGSALRMNPDRHCPHSVYITPRSQVESCSHLPILCDSSRFVTPPPPFSSPAQRASARRPECRRSAPIPRSAWIESWFSILSARAAAIPLRGHPAPRERQRYSATCRSRQP